MVCTAFYLWWPLLLCGTGSVGRTAAQRAGTYSPHRPEPPAEALHLLERDQSGPGAAAPVCGQDAGHSPRACSHRRRLEWHKESIKDPKNQMRILKCISRRQSLLLSSLSSLPVQMTFEPLLWLLSAETWLELSRASGGGAVTDVAPRDCTTRGFFWSSKNQTNRLFSFHFINCL